MAAKDTDARKARIITHLNNDHQASLSLYLRHYAHLSPQDASAPTLLDITLDSMSIQDSSGTVHTIAIDPPMETWADAREKTVTMDREARGALGVPDDNDHLHDGAANGPANASAREAVTEYLFPRKPVHFAVLGLIAFYLTSYTAGQQGLLRPGSWYYEHVMRYFPFGPRGYLRLQEMMFWPAIALHAGEACWMGAKLGKQGVRVGSWLWLEWVVSTMIEGYGAHDRFDGLVVRKQKLGGSKSH